MNCKLYDLFLSCFSYLRPLFFPHVLLEMELPFFCVNILFTVVPTVVRDIRPRRGKVLRWPTMYLVTGYT